MKLSLTVNGQSLAVEASPLKRALDVFREDLLLTGTKEGCGEGECGACTVLVDGLPVNSCLIPICQLDGREIITIEGLEGADHLHPLQDFFISEVGAQCGICTPGMILAAKALLDENPSPSSDEVRVAIAGNLCRCTGYEKIIDSVLKAAACLRQA